MRNNYIFIIFFAKIYTQIAKLKGTKITCPSKIQNLVEANSLFFTVTSYMKKTTELKTVSIKMTRATDL